MPQLIMYVVYGNDEKSQEAEYPVIDLNDATETLREDLRRTADPFWSAQVMERWNEHPGHCEMADQEVTWHFVYKEN